MRPDRKQISLPNWAAWGEDGFVEVDPDVVYPIYLEALKVKKPDRYWLEVARRCFTEDLRRVHGPGLKLRILRRPDWRLDKFPKGAGAEAGSAEFRRHYRKLEAEAPPPAPKPTKVAQAG